MSDGPEDVRDDERQLQANFRRVAAAQARSFGLMRDQVATLLGASQNYYSGVFREGLLRSFLRQVLPKNLEVSTGFIYGFERVPTSKQLDIIVWNSAKHSPVFRCDEFSIVTPESVIAVISVKTRLAAQDLVHGLENLYSVAVLDFAYRHRPRPPTLDEERGHLPILKFLVSYEGATDITKTLMGMSEFYIDVLSREPMVAVPVMVALRDLNPFDPLVEHRDRVDRLFPQMVLSLDETKTSILSGFGPPENPHDESPKTDYGAGTRRLAYAYAQASRLTTPLEKMVFSLLQAAYLTLGTREVSGVSAWGDFDPLSGTRAGDAWEIKPGTGVPLINPLKVAYDVNAYHLGRWAERQRGDSP